MHAMLCDILRHPQILYPSGLENGYVNLLGCRLTAVWKISVRLRSAHRRSNKLMADFSSNHLGVYKQTQRCMQHCHNAHTGADVSSISAMIAYHPCPSLVQRLAMSSLHGYCRFLLRLAYYNTWRLKTSPYLSHSPLPSSISDRNLLSRSG